jgi:hypothetical protein
MAAIDRHLREVILASAHPEEVQHCPGTAIKVHQLVQQLPAAPHPDALIGTVERGGGQRREQHKAHETPPG